MIKCNVNLATVNMDLYVQLMTEFDLHVILKVTKFFHTLFIVSNLVYIYNCIVANSRS